MTSTCTHESRTAVREDGTQAAQAWECDDCGHIKPMTPTEFDWCRRDVPKCTSCGHSDQIGGPLVLRPVTFGSPRLVHATDCR